MANRITLSASLLYAKNNVTVTDLVSRLRVSVTGNGLNSRSAYSAPTSDTVLPLGSVTSAGGWLFIENTDTTNFVTVRAAVAGQKIAKLSPGCFCLFPMDPVITAPSTQSDTAICVLNFAVFDL